MKRLSRWICVVCVLALCLLLLGSYITHAWFFGAGWVYEKKLVGLAVFRARVFVLVDPLVQSETGTPNWRFRSRITDSTVGREICNQWLTRSGKQSGDSRRFVFSPDVSTGRLLVAFPLWVTAIPFAAVLSRRAWLARRAQYRRLSGYCSNCGYDLRTHSGQCPECGQSAPVSSSKAHQIQLAG
jgi:hypothetical protein